MKRSRLLSTACLMTSVATVASAEFVDGTETFDGSTLDSTTWESFGSASATITQDEQLVLVAPVGEAADYTTRNLSVNIGQSVSVDVAVLGGPDPTASFTLALTDNSGSDLAGTLEDSNFLTLEYAPAVSRIFMRRQWPNGILTLEIPFFDAAPSRLEISRIAIDEISYRGYDSSETVVFGVDETTQSPVFEIEDLFISLVSSNSTSPVAFDNVTVSNIPEPSTIGLVGVSLWVLRRRR